MPSGPVSFTVPTGTCQTILPVFRLTADIVPNGGFWQGMPSGDRKRSRTAPNGVPSIGTMPISTACAGWHFGTRNHVVRQTQTHVVDEHQGVVRINRHAAPVHTAERSWELQGTIEARRRIHTFMAHPFELDAAKQLVH